MQQFSAGCRCCLHQYDLCGHDGSARRAVPHITLPANFTLGRPIFTQDISLKKAFTFKEKYKFQLQYDVFNVFNISNLNNYGLGLNDPGFGVATNRLGASSPFGSGGPRAMQVGGRFSF